LVSPPQPVFLAGPDLQQQPLLALLWQQDPLQQQLLLDVKNIETQKSLIWPFGQRQTT
jgi:hypothetical protein